MPKILINEKDITSPGTPSGYANYSVLIPGFMGTQTEEKVKPDSNGVYEFTSVADFEKTIGLIEPKVPLEGSNGEEFVYHYGNQMAYELLNMGYTIIYKVIDKDTFSKLSDEDTWKVFKDKASYDFRFVTHGLLESTTKVPTEKEVLSEIKYEEGDSNYKDAYEELVAAREALKSVKDAQEVLAQIASLYELPENSDEATDEQKGAADIALSFNDLFEDYTSYYDVVDADGKETVGAVNGLASKKVNLETTIKTHEDTYKDKLDEVEKSETSYEFINKVNGCIANLAAYVAAGVGKDSYNDFDSKEISGRGDCIALIELDEKSYTNTTVDRPENLIVQAIAKMDQINESNGKYCAMTVPSVVYASGKKFPGAFHYLACFMNSLQLGFREWYAAAGYTRGVSSYVIDHTTVKLGEIAINALEPRHNKKANENDVTPKFACNVIANFRGSYYLWGNRTAHLLDEDDLVASHFLNIRQLCTTIKKQLYVACRRFTFDPNSDTLWFNFVNAIRPTLETMKADQGIRDYKILKVFTDKKATLKAKIRIIPIEAVEDFDLEVSLEDSFGETNAVTGDIQ